MPDDIPKPKLLDKREVARRLTVSRNTVDNLVSRGELPPPIKIGAASRWLETDIEDYLRHQDYLRKMSPTQTQGDPTAPKDAQARPKRPAGD